MNKNKLFSIIIISLFLISCIIGFYIPKVKAVPDNLSYYSTPLGGGTWYQVFGATSPNTVPAGFYILTPYLIGNGQYLTEVQFLIKNNGGATGNISAFLAISYTGYVTNIVQNSTTSFDVSILPNNYNLVSFMFNGNYALNTSVTYYCGLVSWLGCVNNNLDITGLNPSQYSVYPENQNCEYGNFISHTNGQSGLCISYNVYTNIEFNYAGYLSADDNSFTNVQISYAPTEVDLPQSVSFNYTGAVYNYNGTALSIGGNYSIAISSLTDNSNIFSSYSLSYSQNYNFSGNSFNFTISQRTGTTNLYQVLEVNFTLSNGETYGVLYNLGFLIGNNVIGGTPTPLPSSGGGGYLISLGVSDTYLAVGIYVVSIIGMVIGFFYLHNNNIPFAVGLGLIVATIICNILGILGVYTYPIDILIGISIVLILFVGRG
jgi:hypothetical protein